MKNRYKWHQYRYIGRKKKSSVSVTNASTERIFAHEAELRSFGTVLQLRIFFSEQKKLAGNDKKLIWKAEQKKKTLRKRLNWVLAHPAAAKQR